jgi:hypothetical protein
MLLYSTYMLTRSFQKSSKTIKMISEHSDNAIGSSIIVVVTNNF